MNTAYRPPVSVTLCPAAGGVFFAATERIAATYASAAVRRSRHSESVRTATGDGAGMVSSGKRKKKTVAA
jgi:3'-phosphoadenosine 5'-phosphosulfate (PAPS) 3'-phosphatase